MCLRSLEEEIMFNAHHLLAFKEPLESGFNSQNQQKSGLKKKPSRGFCHALSELYIQESGRYGYKALKKKKSSGVHGCM